MSAGPLAAPVALRELGYDARAGRRQILNMLKPAPDSCVLVTPGNSDAPGATDVASAQQEIH